MRLYRTHFWRPKIDQKIPYEFIAKKNVLSEICTYHFDSIQIQIKHFVSISFFWYHSAAQKKSARQLWNWIDRNDLSLLRAFK